MHDGSPKKSASQRGDRSAGKFTGGAAVQARKMAAGDYRPRLQFGRQLVGVVA